MLKEMIAFCITMALTTFAAERTVIDNERGHYYGDPYDGNHATLGAVVTQPHRDYFTKMDPFALKITHGHFQHVTLNNPQDDFPFPELLAFQNDEKKIGRQPLIVQALYQGKLRDVYFSYTNTLEPRWDFRAVNLFDPRYVHFYIHQYVRKTMWQPFCQNLWMSADNGTFYQSNYGVIDDAGVFIKKVKWVEPYAQDDPQFLESIRTFFRMLKEQSPDIQVIINEGSLADESKYPLVYENVGGSIREDINYQFQTDGYDRDAFYNLLTLRYHFLASNGKVLIGRSLMSSASSTDSLFESRLRTGYLTFLCARAILAQDNFFWGPRYSGGSSTEVAPDLYRDMKNNLGRPTAPLKYLQEPGATRKGYALYSRECEGGVVYLNWTGKEKTIQLPSNKQWVDRKGKRVTTLTISDISGDYALLSSVVRPAIPSINPRCGDTICGPIQVVIGGEQKIAGTTVRYTLDGSDPVSTSPLYTNPFTLNASAQVKAVAFTSDGRQSFVAQSSYVLSPGLPIVEFHLAKDSASEFFDKNYPLLRLSNISAKSVSVQIRSIQSTANRSTDFLFADTTIVFNPYEQYRYYPITIVQDSIKEIDESINLEIYNPQQAVLGIESTYSYTIQDNDGVTGIKVPYQNKRIFHINKNCSYFNLQGRLMSAPTRQVDNRNSSAGIIITRQAVSNVLQLEIR